MDKDHGGDSLWNGYRAFVIDSRGECSDQIDIIIYDRQYSPFLYNNANQG